MTTMLKNVRVQISASIPPDHLKLSIPPREFDRAMLAVCMALVRAGATVVYGGDLRPDGITFKIFRHLARAYADVGRVPFVHVISFPGFARMAYSNLVEALKERRGTCRTFVCASDGLQTVVLGDDEIVIGEGDGSVRLQDQADLTAWIDEFGMFEVATGMSQARATLSAFVDACVPIGGKMSLLDNERDQYSGAMPGIIEEALLALNSGKPVIPLAAYGGSTRDLAISLQLLPEDQRVPRGRQAQSYMEALSTSAALKSLIPDAIVEALQKIALDDRAEIIARETVNTIQSWRAWHADRKVTANANLV